MSCVNKASQQFKDCCKRLDLSEQQLEQIVYDYTNQQGNENTFPTDTYIEQQLRGIPTSELSDSQRELYKLKYEEAQPLDTFEQAQQRVLELQQYYPDDRIRIIQRNNGKYQVVVNTDYSQEETEQEIQQIKSKAIADGTFMKAPNGNPTNLNERQWLQVRTKNFINWFGDWINDPANASKVVDENGEPLVVYHGSDNVFTTYDLSKSDDNSTIFTTNNINIADSYISDVEFYGIPPETLNKNDFTKEEWESIEKQYEADVEDYEKRKANQLKPIHLFNNIKNPFILDANNRGYDELSIEGYSGSFNTREVAAFAKEKGYDGVILLNIKDAGSVKAVTYTKREITQELIDYAEVYGFDINELLYVPNVESATIYYYLFY